MTGWVALLRGVNVGGITIRSGDLREVFDGLGLSDVRTVLASGNVVFESGSTEDRGPGVVYWHPAKGHTTDTPFAKLIARSVYRTRTTNRNLRTLAKIIG